MPLSAGIDDAWPSRLPSGEVPDWLKQLISAPGAQQPYGPGGAPISGAGPSGEMPGGGLLGYNAATPGAPSMGYPALGGPPQPQSQAQPEPFSVARWLAALNPISSANAAEAPARAPSSGGGATPPLPANALPLAWGNPTGEDYRHWLDAQLVNSGPPAAPPAGGAPTPRRSGSGYGGVPPAGWGAPPRSGGSGYGGVPPAGWGDGQPYTAMPWRGPIADAPAGSPSKTPRPASSSPFIRIDKVNAGPLAQPGRGYQTALDLSQLFKRG